MTIRSYQSVRGGQAAQYRLLAAVCGALLTLPPIAMAQDLQQVQVTATKTPTPLTDIPVSLSMVEGQELRERGATDLRTATALLAGVDAPPGGDAGPSSAVPSMMGLSEFDAFLLVLDGVPWGGAFNPAIASLRFNDVQRIELMRGAAPVMFGATSFVGVIHVLRYPAGEAENLLQLGTGSYGSVSGSLSVALPELNRYRQSLALDVEHNRFHGDRQGVDTEHVLYRGANDVGAGTLRVDLEYTHQRQLPGSPVVLAENALTKETPLDGNFNPADAQIRDQRGHVRLEYSRELPAGQWDTTLSVVRSTGRDVRGFLRPKLISDPEQSDDGYNADGFDQQRRIDDAYLDTHLNIRLSTSAQLTAGVDWLHGKATQASANFGYFLPLDGSQAPPTSQSRPIDEVNGIADRRDFAGIYMQADYHVSEHWSVLGGLRFNRTTETRDSTHVDTHDAANNEAFSDRQNNSRWSGMLGVTFAPFADKGPAPRTMLFANYRNAFKPASIDLGPDVRPDILRPETARILEVGARGASVDARVHWEISAFDVDFRNLVVAQIDANGSPILANAGNERLRGVEGETRWRLLPSVTLLASYSYHDATFRDTTSTQGGAQVNLDGRQLPLTAHHMGAVGVLYSAPRLWSASIVAKYVGSRYLDRQNLASVPAYTTVDARLALAVGQYTLSLNAYNATNRRDAAASSEFGESSFYLLPARRVSFNLARAL